MVGVLPPQVAENFPHRYAIVDVETTGLNPENDRVVQVAVAQMDSDGTVTHRWSTLVDPECDPGPTHIHGIAASDLVGAPRYARIIEELHDLLHGRVLVAHNARFDWSFLAHEARRLETRFPVSKRLCTLRLSQALDHPVHDFKLATLCAYWGVRQTRAHDAADDVRVLVEVTRHSLVLAEALSMELPVVTPPPLDGWPKPAPRTPSVYRYPGRYSGRGPLIQGMTVVVTGETTAGRAALVAEAAARGLDVMNSVSSRTSLLVSNGESRTRKAELARKHGTVIVDEQTFLDLMTCVDAGQRKAGSAAQESGLRLCATEARAPHETVSTPLTQNEQPVGPRSGARRASGSTKRTVGPLTGRRVLVLGGRHHEAAQVRDLIQEYGGTAAVNLTASVTDVVPLDGGKDDPRWPLVLSRGLGAINEAMLRHPLMLRDEIRAEDRRSGEAHAADSVPLVLARGGVADLNARTFSVDVSWDASRSGDDVDVVGFVANGEGTVDGDDDFVFYNNSTHGGGAVELELGDGKQAVAHCDVTRLSQDRRITLAAVIDGASTFGEIGALELTVRSGDGVALMRATLDAGSTEKSMLLAEVYWRGDTVRFRAVGQGYEEGLAPLAVSFGVDIEES